MVRRRQRWPRVPGRPALWRHQRGRLGRPAAHRGAQLVDRRRGRLPALPGETYGIPAVVGYNGPTGRSFGMYSASAIVRGRSPGMVRFHMLGTFGYYDLATRTHFAGGRPDQVEHDWSPGFSLGLGVSGSELVRPGFQLRWHETLSPDHVNMDVVTFEVGLHFN